MTLENAESLLNRAKTACEEMLLKESLRAHVVTYDQNDDVMTTTFFESYDREKWADAIYLLGKAIPCSTISLVTDSYFSNAERKTNGKKWKSGDMEKAWLNDTEDKKLVTEGLTVMMCGLDGKPQSGCAHYKREDGKIIWGHEEIITADDGEMKGLFPAALSEGMLHRKSATELAAQGPFAAMPLNILNEYIICSTLALVSTKTKVVHALPMQERSTTIAEIAKQVFQGALGGTVQVMGPEDLANA